MVYGPLAASGTASPLFHRNSRSSAAIDDSRSLRSYDWISATTSARSRGSEQCASRNASRSAAGRSSATASNAFACFQSLESTSGLHPVAQPGGGGRQLALDGRGRDVHRLGDLVDLQAPEIPQLDDRRLARIERRQLRERVVQR